MPNPPWRSFEPELLNPASLAALFANEIPAIRIPSFCTAAECAAFERAIDVAIAHGAMKHYSFEPPLGYIGMTQFEYRHKPKQAYFADVAESSRRQHIVLDRSFDAVGRILEMIEANCDGRVALAQEPDGMYFAGNIRDSSQGAALHADFAPYSAPGYLIGDVVEQVSWNLFVSVPEVGGRTTVYNTFWQADVTPGQVVENQPGSFAWDKVEGAQRFVYQPRPGEAVIFNSRNLHIFEGGKADSRRRRLQINAFLGKLPGGDLVMWS